MADEPTTNADEWQRDREVIDGATPGPCTVIFECDPDEWTASRHIHICGLDLTIHDAEWSEKKDWDRDMANAVFIARARTRWPASLAELRKVTAERDELRAEVERLSKIIERLPTTADGVPIVPGMKLYPIKFSSDDFDGLDPYAIVGFWAIDPNTGKEIACGWSFNYSTQAAAAAAKGREMTPEQKEEQRRSFAHGNSALANPLIDREMINQEADRLKGEACPECAKARESAQAEYDAGGSAHRRECRRWKFLSCCGRNQLGQ